MQTLKFNENAIFDFDKNSDVVVLPLADGGEGTVEAQIAAAVDAEKQRAEGIEGGLRTDVDAVAGRMTTAEGKITALETESAKHALKTELEAVDAKFADYNTTVTFITEEEHTALSFKNGDYIFVPDVRKAVEEKASVINAYVVGESLKEVEFKLGELTEVEREIILKGCLINYYRG